MSPIQVNFDKIERISQADPDVDIQKMQDTLSKTFGETITPERSKTSESEQVTSDFATLPIDPRGDKSRPGLGEEKLRNNDYLRDPERVYNNDRIPLKTYRKMSMDPEISFGTKLIKSWIGSLPFSVETKDKRMRSVVEYVLEDVWSNLIRDMLDSIAMGFAFGEKVWQRESVMLTETIKGKDKVIFDGKVVSLEKIKFLDPLDDFKYWKSKKDEIAKVEQWQGAEKVTVDRDKLVWFALDRKYSGIFGESRYKNIYTDWYYSKVNQKYTLNDLQKRGSPHIEVRYPVGKTELSDGTIVDNQEVAQKIAKKLMSDGVVAMPSKVNEGGDPKWSVEYADTKQGVSESPFIEFLKYTDKKKLKGLGVPPAVTDGESNFSTMDAQGDMLVIIVEDIVNQLEEKIQEDVVDQVVEHNFGPRAKSLVNLKIDKSALGRRQMAKEILKGMMRAGTSMKEKSLSSWPDPVSLMNDLGITSASIDEAFVDAPGTDRKQNDPQSQEEKKEDSNDTDRSRDPDDEQRDRERPSERESVTE
jgi:hypothetical protein